MTMRWGWTWAAGLVAALAWVAPANAQLAPSCTLSTTSVQFGLYDVFAAAPLSSTGTVTVKCNASAVNIAVTLDRGASGTFNPRKPSNGTQALDYNLYRDAAGLVIWGDGSGGTSFYADANPRNNKNVTHTVFGRIPAGQDVPAGTYSDTIVATINF